LSCEEQKGTIRRVECWKTTLSILAALSASLALADDFKTTNGKEYKNVTVSRVEPDGIVLTRKSGIVKVYFVELPKEVQERFGYDAAAAKAAEEKRIEEQKAVGRERAEKEENAEADLHRSHEQFQATEKRASQTYESAAKGTLSGQIFISTKGGENFKLGAVQLALFARDAIDSLLPSLKNYADYKIQQLSGPVAETKAALDQAATSERAAYDAQYQAITAHGDYMAAKHATDLARKALATARNQYLEITGKLNFYYSGAFYFAFLQSPIQTADTDADGKFAIEVPQTGRFVIAAQAQRSIGKDTERYYWLQPVSLEGQQQRTQNLSNNNLTRTTGTSSLVITQD
jgi:hypothetical protein